MKAPYLVVLIALATYSFASDDIRSKVVEVDGKIDLDRTIDLGKSIFGIPLGTTEDEFIKTCGKPDGYMSLQDEETLMLYGTGTAFLFQSGRLAGVMLEYAGFFRESFGFTLGQKVRRQEFVPYREWELSNGIKPFMSLADIRKILDEQLKPWRSQGQSGLEGFSFLGPKSRVAMLFVGIGEGEELKEGWEKDENNLKLGTLIITPF
jgi:hypothetical protein